MQFIPYDRQDLRRGLGEPSLIRRELGRRLRVGRTRVNNAWYKLTTPDGYDLAEEDWDVVVILDGCRYDQFAMTNWLDGTLESRISPASESWEFMRSNFQDRQFHDTVYVTANPHWYKLDDGVFHHVVDLLSSAWDDEHNTVLPGAVAERALAAHERFPKKRLVVHFMQPHFPFIGERGRQLDQKGITLHLDEESGMDEMNIWSAAERGKVPLEEVEAAYAENLGLALPHVDRLLEELPGKKIVTADHGNLIGDLLLPIPVRAYGHPPGLRVPELVTVPWLTVPGDPIEAVSEPPLAQDQSKTHATKRLRALGYL